MQNRSVNKHKTHLQSLQKLVKNPQNRPQYSIVTRQQKIFTDGNKLYTLQYCTCTYYTDSSLGLFGISPPVQSSSETKLESDNTWVDFESQQ